VRAEGAGEAPRPEPARDQTHEAGVAPQREGSSRGGSAVDGGKKEPGLLGRGRGRLTSPDDRKKALQILDEGIADGARGHELGVGLTTLQRCAANSPVMVMASIAAKAAIAMWRIASARRNANGVWRRLDRRALCIN
jgi:hypothetical protein